MSNEIVSTVLFFLQTTKTTHHVVVVVVVVFKTRGDCGSCSISVGGQRIKACVGKVPPEPRLKSLQEKGLEIR